MYSVFFALPELAMAEQQNQAVFREVQRWSPAVRSLLVLLVLATAAGTAVAYIVAERGSPGTAWPFVAIAAKVVGLLAVAVLLWTFRLETVVRRAGLYIRCTPFHRRWRQFAAQELSECYARTYRPILEYGGWGIRWGWKGRAYNVSGHEGVQLVLKNGKRLLVGSQRSHELETAVRSIL